MTRNALESTTDISARPIRKAADLIDSHTPTLVTYQPTNNSTLGHPHLPVRWDAFFGCVFPKPKAQLIK